jgi:PAS domain S-box-containing protein
MHEEKAVSGRTPDIEYFQRLADGAPVMIWMSGPDMGCFYFNRAWLDFRGRTTEQEFGNGWAEGVHPEDLQRCVQHYVSSFEQRVAFAMSYRLQNGQGEYRWILDRGAPHYSANGEFLGFFGGCAETTSETTVDRIAELTKSIRAMREFALRIANEQAEKAQSASGGDFALLGFARRLHDQHRAHQAAAAQFGQLADDMLLHERIPIGACLR